MAKVKNFDIVNKKIEKLLKDEIATKSTMEEIGEFVVNRIRNFARTGYGLYSGKKKKFKKLSESYKDMRRGAVKFRTINGQVVPFNEPDEKLKEVDKEWFSPEKSNLTFSGQMLRALGYNVDKKSVVIDVENSSRSGKYEKLTNREVKDYVQQNGREFMGLDRLGVARVKQIILDNIRRAIINNRLNKR